jgi:hypothetical protein
MGTDQTIAAWENDGGALGAATFSLVGTENQLTWAEQIKASVDAEFDRVATALESVAAHQTSSNQLRTRLAIAILEDHRGAVMARCDAGYFIKDWQDIREQVRLLITADARYKMAKVTR